MHRSSLENDTNANDSLQEDGHNERPAAVIRALEQSTQQEGGAIDPSSAEAISLAGRIESDASGRTLKANPTTSSDRDNLPLQAEWSDPGEPDAEELRGMTAFDGGTGQFKEKLGKLATAHWDRSTTVKEGETIINFAYAVRMRSES